MFCNRCVIMAKIIDEHSDGRVIIGDNLLQQRPLAALIGEDGKLHTDGAQLVRYVNPAQCVPSFERKIAIATRGSDSVITPDTVLGAT